MSQMKAISIRYSKRKSKNFKNCPIPLNYIETDAEKNGMVLDFESYY